MENVSEYLKKCSLSQVIVEIYIKTKSRSICLSGIKMAKITKTTKNGLLSWEMSNKGNPNIVLGLKTCEVILENRWMILKAKNIYQLIQLCHPLGCAQRTWYPLPLLSIKRSKKWKQPIYSINDKWLVEVWYWYT